MFHRLFNLVQSLSSFINKFWLKKMDTPNSLYSIDPLLSMLSTPPWLQDGINFIQVRKIILIFVFVMLKGSGDNNFNSSDIPSWVYVSSNPNLTTVILKDNQLSGTLNLSGGYRRSLQLIDFQNNGITELEFGNQMLNFNLRGNGVDIIIRR